MKVTKLVLIALVCLTLCMGACIGTYAPEATGGGEAGVITPNPSPDQGGEQPPVDDSGEYEEFIPGILDYDPNVPSDFDYDFSTIYDYTGAKLTAASGSFLEVEGIYASSGGSALYVNRDENTPFPYGTFSAKVMNNGTDSGIVFGLSSNKNSFWEGAGISYYFYFVSFSGMAYLGKADNGGWAALSEKQIANYSASNTYELKVIYKGNKILCFVNGVQMLSYSETAPLKGTGWGIRAGGADVVISDLAIASTFDM